MLTGWEAFDLATATWEAEDLPGEALPRAALAALDAGCDTPSLCVLAGLVAPAWSEVRPLIARIRAERGLPELSTAERDELRMVDLAARIVDGELTPRQGAREAWALVTELDRHGDDELSPIAYVDDSYDLLGVIAEDRGQLDAIVVSAARALLARRGLLAP